ncbi:MAG: hypothetical protein EPN64_08680 [Burkholderiaceae bacterium]|nr:MAG: hypothetical protein EPN64_08680 [Burkholderiaceae bacterium]
MPGGRNTDLTLQQRRLVLRSAHLRRTLAGQAAELRAPLALIDTGWAVGRWLRQNPYAVMGPVVLLAALRPIRTLRWMGCVLRGWRMFRRGARWLASTARSRH